MNKRYNPAKRETDGTKKKIIIFKKYYGTIELAATKNAYYIFIAIIRAFKAKENFSINLLYSAKKIKSFEHYQKGGSDKELQEIEMYIQMCELFNKDSQDAQDLRQSIGFVNDNAHVNLNISKQLHLSNKKQASQTKGSNL